MDEQSRLTDQMPATIGRYKVLESIGFGAMGAVYKAFDPLIKRTLAIKTIRLDIPRQSPQYKSFIERFYHEARISGTLAHPHIVTLFDIGEEGGVPYLAMEFVEGETIASLLDKGLRFKPERVIALVSQVAAALDYAHTKGVIHRDIKPSNLILYDTEKVKVTDFGIAKLVDAEMTQSGTLLGTPSYMSPEQAMGEKLDGRSDIFSLGVCAFEMLSGEQPFPGANVTSILYKLVHVDPIEPANLEMHGLVPQKWHEVFGRVLAKKPDDRYQNAGAFVQDLEYCLGSWFGSIGEQTVVTERTMSEANQPDTGALPRIDLTPSASAPLAPPPFAALDDTPVTVMLKPDTELATVLLQAPAITPPSPPVVPATPAPAPVAAPVAPVPAHDPSEATVMMKSPVPTPARPAPSAPSPAPNVSEPHPMEATMLMNTDALVSVPGEATVLMNAPQPLPPPADKPRPPMVGEATVTTSRPKPGAPRDRPRPLVPSAPEATASAAAPVSRPAKPGIPAALIVGGGLVAVLVAAGALAFVLWKNRGATQTEPSAAPTAEAAAPETTPSALAPMPKGFLRIETQPAGALVLVNGQTKGPAPLEFGDLPLGAYEVKVELKGYEPRIQALNLTEAEPRVDLKLALNRVGPVLVAAEVVSNPAGANVAIDGVNAGVTPLSGHRLKPGTHQVEVTKEGFEPWTGTLNAQAGKPARLDAQLKAAAKATPPPTPGPDPVDTARVYANSTSDKDAPVDVIAKKTSGPSVSYAPRLRTGESVSVTLSFVVDEQGEVSDIRVVESGGKQLDDAAVQAVQKWKYTPATKQGIKVKVRHSFRQTYRAG